MTDDDHKPELARAIAGMESGARAASRFHPEAMTPAQFGQFVFAFAGFSRVARERLLILAPEMESMIDREFAAMDARFTDAYQQAKGS